jgi:hypothetical protein
MAIDIGSLVTPKNIGTGATRDPQNAATPIPQPPLLFGRVVAAGDPAPVFWLSTGRQEMCAHAALDEVTDASAASQALVGKVVTVMGDAPACDLQWVVDCVFRRGAAGAGDEWAVLRRRVGDAGWREVGVPCLTVVTEL